MATTDQHQQLVSVLVDIKDQSAAATEKLIVHLETLNKSLLELSKQKPNDNVATGLKKIATAGEAAAKALQGVREALKGNVIGRNLANIATSVQPAAEGLTLVRTKAKETVTALQGLGRTGLNSKKIKTQAAEIVTSLQSIIAKSIEVKAALVGTSTANLPTVTAPVVQSQQAAASAATDTSGIDKQIQAEQRLTEETKKATAAEKERQSVAQAAGAGGLEKASATVAGYTANLERASAQAVGLQTRIKSANEEQARAGTDTHQLVAAEKSRRNAINETEKAITAVNAKIAQTSGVSGLEEVSAGYLKVRSSLEGTLTGLRAQNTELGASKTLIDQQNAVLTKSQQVWGDNTTNATVYNESIARAVRGTGDLSDKTKELSSISGKASTSIQEVSQQLEVIRGANTSGILGPGIEAERQKLEGVKTSLEGVKTTADGAKESLKLGSELETATKKSASAFDNLKAKITTADEAMQKLATTPVGEQTAAQFNKARQAIDAVTKSQKEFEAAGGKKSVHAVQAEQYAQTLTKLESSLTSAKAKQEAFKTSGAGVADAQTKQFQTLDVAARKAALGIEETGKQFAGLSAGKLSADLGGSDLEKLQDTLIRTKTELRNIKTAANKSLDALGNNPGTAKLKQQFESLRDAATSSGRVIGQRLTQVNQKLADIGQGGELTNLGSKYATTMREMTEAGAFMFKRVAGFFQRLGKATNASTQELQNYVFAIETLEKQLVRFRSGVVTWAIGLVLLGTTISAPFLKALKITTEFSDKIAQAGAVTNATQSEFDALANSAESMGRITRFTATQAAEALLFLGRAGFEANKAIQVLPTTLNLAAAAAIDLGKAADIVTNIMTSFEIEAENLGFAADVLTKAFTSSNATLENIGFSFTYVGSLAKGLGVEFEDATAAIAKLANAGFKGTLAGTALRGILDALFNPTRAEAKILEELSASLGLVGLQIKNQEGNFVGFVRLLEQLEEAGFNSEDALKLFGQRAGPGVAALLRVGSKELKTYRESLDAAEGTTAKIAATMESTFRGEILKMVSALEGLGQSVGSNLSVGLGKAAEVIARLVNTITELREAFPLLAVVFDYAAASLAALIAAAGIFTFTMFLMVVPLRQLIAAIATFNATMALGAQSSVIVTGALDAETIAIHQNTVALQANARAVGIRGASVEASVALTNASAAATGSTGNLAGPALGGGIKDFLKNLKTNFKSYFTILKSEIGKSIGVVSKSSFSLAKSFSTLGKSIVTSGLDKFAIVMTAISTAGIALGKTLKFIGTLVIFQRAAWVKLWAAITFVGNAIIGVIRWFVLGGVKGLIFKAAIVALTAAYFLLGESIDVVIARLGKQSSLITAQQKELAFFVKNLIKTQTEINKKQKAGNDPLGLQTLQTDLQETALKIIDLAGSLDGVDVDFKFDSSGALEKLTASYKDGVQGVVLYTKEQKLTGKALDANIESIRVWQATIQSDLASSALEVTAKQVHALTLEIRDTTQELNQLNEDLQDTDDPDDRKEIRAEINALLGKRLSLQQQVTASTKIAGLAEEDQKRILFELLPYLKKQADEVWSIFTFWKSSEDQVQDYLAVVRAAGEESSRTAKLIAAIDPSAEIQTIIRSFTAQLADTEAVIADIKEKADDLKDTLDEAFDLDIESVEGSLNVIDQRFDHEIEAIERNAADRERAALSINKGETKSAVETTKIILESLTQQRFLRKKHYNDAEKQLLEFQAVQTKILERKGDKEAIINLNKFILEQQEDRLEKEKAFEESSLTKVKDLRKAAYEKLKNLETGLTDFRNNQRQLEIDFRLKTGLAGASDERKALIQRNEDLRKIRLDYVSSLKASLAGENDEAVKFAEKAQAGISSLLGTLDGDTFGERQFIRRLESLSSGVDSTFENASSKVKKETETQAVTFDVSIKRMEKSLKELTTAIQDVAVALGAIPRQLGDAKDITEPFEKAATSLGSFKKALKLLETRQELNIISPKELDKLQSLQAIVGNTSFAQGLRSLETVDLKKISLGEVDPEALRSLFRMLDVSKETRDEFTRLTGVDPFAGIDIPKLKTTVATLSAGLTVDEADVKQATAEVAAMEAAYSQAAGTIIGLNSSLNTGETILGSNKAAEAVVQLGNVTSELEKQKQVAQSLGDAIDASQDFLEVKLVADQTTAALLKLKEAEREISEQGIEEDSVVKYKKEVKGVLDIMSSVPLQLAKLESKGLIDVGQYDEVVESINRWRTGLSKIKETDALTSQKAQLDLIKLDMAEITDRYSELFKEQTKELDVKLHVDPSFVQGIATMRSLEGLLDSMKAKLQGLKIVLPTGEAVTNVKALEKALVSLSSVGYNIAITPKIGNNAKGGFIKFATGGLVDAVMAGLGGLSKFAGGGPTSGNVRGAGTGTSDSILSWLSNGEYVMDSMTTKFFGPGFFRGLQDTARRGFLPDMALPAFATGGPVGIPDSVSKLSSRSVRTDHTKLTLDVTGEGTYNLQGSRGQVKGLVKALKHVGRGLIK